MLLLLARPPSKFRLVIVRACCIQTGRFRSRFDFGGVRWEIALGFTIRLEGGVNNAVVAARKSNMFPEAAAPVPDAVDILVAVTTGATMYGAAPKSAVVPVPAPLSLLFMLFAPVPKLPFPRRAPAPPPYSPAKLSRSRSNDLFRLGCSTVPRPAFSTWSCAPIIGIGHSSGGALGRAPLADAAAAAKSAPSASVIPASDGDRNCGYPVGGAPGCGGAPSADRLPYSSGDGRLLLPPHPLMSTKPGRTPHGGDASWTCGLGAIVGPPAGTGAV
mmetsp:Transcript_5557/g.13917  ORF Transcript_5557/g.13917 Transcript_5557/m.13917 type:complete len:273 (-) Transcript_5557:2628-3446(-)